MTADELKPGDIINETTKFVETSDGVHLRVIWLDYPGCTVPFHISHMRTVDRQGLRIYTAPPKDR